jgi:hypothetical protein
VGVRGDLGGEGRGEWVKGDLVLEKWQDLGTGVTDVHRRA